MGFFKDFLAKKHDTEDEERGGTSIIFPERVMALILLVKKDAIVPASKSARDDLLWRVFSAVNPELYASLPDRDQVKTHLYQTGAMKADGYIEPDDYLDPLDDLQIPNMASGYIQALKLANKKITIWLREAGTKDKEFNIELTKPLVTSGFSPPEDATLITIYASDMPKLMSTLWPALPKSLD
jgi:hypothetical protein